MATESQLKKFHQNLGPQEVIADDHPWYVPLLGADPVLDPIRQLAGQVDFATSESVHLLTGFRGNGKSTQLRRLRHLLEGRGHTVFLVNMLDWMMMSKPIELTDFLLSVVGAFDEECEARGVGGASFWERSWEWISQVGQVRVGVGAAGGSFEAQVGGATTEVRGAAFGVELKAALQGDSTFKAMLQSHLRGRVSHLVRSVQEYVAARVDAIRAQVPNTKVVLLVDSVEQLRGTGGDADRVQNSALELFTAEAENLRIPQLHVVYTFPPSLLPEAQNLGRAYGSSITLWPNVHVRDRSGAPDPRGLTILRSVVEKRYDGLSPVLTEAQFTRLAEASGGDLRDYFRLVRDCVVQLDIAGLGVADDALVDRCIARLRRDLLPLADEDARWLARIHARKDVALERRDQIPTLMRFFDSNLIMNYQNGSTWYDVHPLVVDEIERLTRGVPP